MKNRAWPVIKEWLEALVVAAAIAFLISTFIVQLFKIPTGSMTPTLQAGDRIVVNKFIYGAKLPFVFKNIPALRPPKRGDIMVFIFPGADKKDYIKRVIALPGESVEIKGGMVYINGRPLKDEPFNRVYYYSKGDFSREGHKLVVPENSFFVLGDNSAISFDSRWWGCVDRKYVLGKAIAIFWPPFRIRILK
ncbi:MAG: signal peptidase I [Candidatus Omnitrophica bacterium]|nr:signal peptidase I [Candidatus Omnitrophota bacterium]